MTGGFCGSALIAFTVLLPSLPQPSGQQYLEARLCTSGRTIRIPIPGQEKPDREAPMPCHAVCARDGDPLKKRRRTAT